jgi:PKD repeat protein
VKWNKPIYASLIALFMGTSILTANGQCSGFDFTPDQTQVCAPKLVKFFIQNAPAGASYTWDYGFGQAAGKDTGQYIYTTPGTYTVTLKITLSDGTVCTVTKPNIIEVFSTPVARFVVSRPVLCNGADTVSITDVSTGGSSRTWSVDGLPLADTAAKIVLSFTK